MLDFRVWGCKYLFDEGGLAEHLSGVSHHTLAGSGLSLWAGSRREWVSQPLFQPVEKYWRGGIERERERERKRKREAHREREA